MAYLLQQLLTEAAARRPQQAAIADPHGAITYTELDELSNKMAWALLQAGVARGDRVGILAPKSTASLIAIYGVLKAAACYVPLDPKAPAERLRYIVRDSGIAVIIADEVSISQAASIVAAAPSDGTDPKAGCVVVTSDTRSGTKQAADPSAAGSTIVPWAAVDTQPAGPVTQRSPIETDLAYILYTSGSTGAPKGVMISHRNSLTFVEWAAAAAGLGQEDRVCSPAPLHFDLSVFDVFATCRAGACVTIMPEGTATFPASLAQWLAHEHVTVWYSVPSVLTLLACYGGLRQRDLSKLRTVIFAGEVFPPKYLARLMAELPHPRYLNWYGPTETNVCTAFEVPAGWAEENAVPIGAACENTEVFAVSSDGGLVTRPGDVGELYVRGPSLMRGYWGQPALTRAALAPSPVRPDSGELVYRTGDLVAIEPGGNFRYLGRRDSMVKIRGYRVELGEVEAALYRHPAVQEAVVLPAPDQLLGNRLRAVVTAAGAGSLTRESVLAHCRQWLPSYMVPDIIDIREVLPRTSTGKVDRVSLASA